MTVRVERHGAVALVVLDRPETRNAITDTMRRQLWEAYEEAALDSSVRAVVLTGAGGHFSSGADIGTFGGGGMPGSLGRMHELGRVNRAIYHLKKPTLAAVGGVCAGMSWGFALCCDLVLAAEDAKFVQIFRNVALAPDGGSVWLLNRLVGPMRTKELCYSGRVVRADEAMRLGLALEVLPPDALLPRALELATELAAGPGISAALAKRQVDLAATMSFDQFLEAEHVMQPVASRSEDHAEGIAAFREKRKPDFRSA
ncbi:enoyl-CoA hydratase/isomerase family protein [Sandaracinobacter sp. RS1-74]|uniref:enoyl-CoA hydratase/isomerase family protein n=1 Tax=Sandaracinobacteroides sayramensis TaxID=2913411 RepID=UPI001EDAFFF0|nr:enoyl-CoA hydratase/isomerase family protein [Sandaracinobacteroides sayramensis]MCG2840958.1 enoyl-CoA hydratase/isomerase family protein [Sandaracinobacteroides sayramensis]